MAHLVKWKDIDAYLLDEGVYAPVRYVWTPNPKHATPFRDEDEARIAFRDSGAGREDNLEIVKNEQ